MSQTYLFKMICDLFYVMVKIKAQTIQWELLLQFCGQVFPFLSPSGLNYCFNEGMKGDKEHNFSIARKEDEGQGRLCL